MANFTEGLQKIPYFQDGILPWHTVHGGHGDINFLMYGDTTEFRVRTLLTKEPETICWIDEFNPGDVLWDIGANIGCYSLYAASRGVKVVAFEPSPVNYWLLTSNAIANHFNDIITAFSFGLSNVTGVQIWQPHMSAGSAENQINTSGGVCGLQTYRIDDIVALDKLGFPQHIKLDVDGIERLILEGADQTLADTRLRSVLCEVDESNKMETEGIIKLMLSKGFSLPVTRHAPYFDESHYAPTFNYLFIRL